MFRRLILAVSFVTWLMAMWLVNEQTRGRREVTPSDASEQAAFSPYFGERAEDNMAWELYTRTDGEINPQQVLANVGAKPAGSADGKPAWDGISEDGLRLSGFIRMKNTRKHETRVAQDFKLAIHLPEKAGGSSDPAAMLFKNFAISATADISMEYGLENFNSLMIFGLGMSANIHGNRDNDKIVVNLGLNQAENRLFSHRMEISAGNRSIPDVNGLLFQPRRELAVGTTWESRTIDMQEVINQNAALKMRSIKFTCTAQKKIKYDGLPAIVYEVSAPDAEAMAWYSLDGVVLKQTFKLAGSLEVMAVRMNPQKPDPVFSN